jgi:hypothetical protein
VKDHLPNDERGDGKTQQASVETQMLKEDTLETGLQQSDANSQILMSERPQAELHQSSSESQDRNDESQQSIIREMGPKEGPQAIDLTVLAQAIDEGTKKPKITVYSPIIASVMRYKEITIPRFKLSPAVETRLEKVLRRENSELWKSIEEKMKWKKKKESICLNEPIGIIDLDVLNQAIEEGKKYPKVSIYSPIVAAFMRYSEITTPRFKLSPAVEGRLEKVLKGEDPELWKAVEEKIQWKKRKR